jgi:hypothetical protein
MVNLLKGMLDNFVKGVAFINKVVVPFVAIDTLEGEVDKIIEGVIKVGNFVIIKQQHVN